MNTSKIVAKNSGISLISQVISLIFQIINRTIFIAYLGVELLGLNSTFASLLGALSLAELGIQTAVVYSLYKPLNEKNYDEINKIMNVFKVMYRYVGIFFIVATIVCLPILDYIISGIEVTKSVYLFFLLQAASSISTYFLAYKRILLYADQREYLSKLVDMGFNIIFSTLKIVSIIIFESYYIYLILQLIQTIGSNIYVHFICRKIYPYITKGKMDKGILKRISSDIKNVFVSRIAAYIYSSTDNLIISAMISTVSVGYLVNYTIITTNIKNISKSILNPIAPIIGRMLMDDKKNINNDQVFNTYSHVRYIFAGIILIPTLLLIEDFIKVWVGDYLLGSLIAILLVADLYIHFVHGACVDFINGKGLFKREKYIEINGAIINIFLSIFLGLKFGIAGVKVGTLLTQTFYWISRSYVVFNYILKGNRNIYKYWIVNLYGIMVFSIAFVISKLIYSNIDINIFVLKFLVGAISSVIIFLLIYLLMFSRNNELKLLITGLRKFIKNRQSAKK